MNKIYELKNQRATLLDAAEKAVEAKDMTTYDAKMADVKALNAQIEALEALENEGGKFATENETPISLAAQGLTDKNDIEYVASFLYALSNGLTPKSGKGDEKLLPLYNALTEAGGTPAGADGGFLVPTEFNNLINEQRRQLIALADLFNVETVTAPTGWRAVDTAPTTGFTACDENGTIAKDSQPAFTKVSYALSKFALRVPVSTELMEDNTANLMAYLARWFGKKGVITENIKLKALLDTLTAANLTVGKEVDALKSTITKDLDPSVSALATIITNQSGFAYLDGLTGTDGKGLISPDPTTGNAMIFKNHRIVMLSDSELPNRVVTTTGATKGTYYPVYIGDYKSFGTLFKRKALEVASTNIGGDAWANDGSEVRGVIRIDAQKLDTGAAIKREIFVAAV